jgi:hypothetical protein
MGRIASLAVALAALAVARPLEADESRTTFTMRVTYPDDKTSEWTVVPEGRELPLKSKLWKCQQGPTHRGTNGNGVPVASFGVLCEDGRSQLIFGVSCATNVAYRNSTMMDIIDPSGAKHIVELGCLTRTGAADGSQTESKL